MDLTIVVCTIPERDQLLRRCLFYLEHQSDQDFDVLVVHGPGPKGDKLNRAFPRVRTSHLMICDDDDWVSERLVASVKPHTADFVGYDALQLVDGKFNQVIHQSTASHICPIRTDLAAQVPFGNEYLADVHWTNAVAQLVETEAYIDDVLYFYDKWVGPTDSWSPPRPAGFWPHDKSRHMWL